MGLDFSHQFYTQTTIPHWRTASSSVIEWRVDRSDDLHQDFHHVMILERQ